MFVPPAGRGERGGGAVNVCRRGDSGYPRARKAMFGGFLKTRAGRRHDGGGLQAPWRRTAPSKVPPRCAKRRRLLRERRFGARHCVRGEILCSPRLNSPARTFAGKLISRQKTPPKMLGGVGEIVRFARRRYRSGSALPPTPLPPTWQGDAVVWYVAIVVVACISISVLARKIRATGGILQQAVRACQGFIVGRGEIAQCYLS